MPKTFSLKLAGLAFLAAGVAGPALAQSAPSATDYKNPIRDCSHNGIAAYHVTVCEGSTGPGAFVWKTPLPGASSGKVTGAANEEALPRGGRHAATAGSAGGTALYVNVSGRHVGDSQILLTLNPDNGSETKVYLTVHVIRCDNTNINTRGVREAAKRPVPELRETVKRPALERPTPVPASFGEREKQGGC